MVHTRHSRESVLLKVSDAGLRITPATQMHQAQKIIIVKWTILKAKFGACAPFFDPDSSLMLRNTGFTAWCICRYKDESVVKYTHACYGSVVGTGSLLLGRSS